MTTELPPRIRIALLFGGKSPEHDVSVLSAQSMRRALDPARFEVIPMAIDREGRWLPAEESHRLLGTSPDGPATAWEPACTTAVVPAERLVGAVDVVFPVLHGPYGEDGTVQGLLELLDVPYVGAGVAGSAVGMDKALMKALFQQAGLPVLPYVVVKRARWQQDAQQILAQAVDHLSLPCFVKPANMGSSIGISRVDRAEELAPAIDLAFAYDDKVVVERGAVGYREIECGMLGNEDADVSVPGEILVHGSFYDYETKYTDGAAGLQVPAAVGEETCRMLQQLALRACEALEISGMARVDFLVAPDEAEIWVSEVNTIPGFTPYSMYPLLWQASGVPYAELIGRLVTLALERHASRRALRRVRLPERR
jgi:D-alanine-D-alanine ligase